MQLKNKLDFWSGIMFVLLGIGFAIGATNYTMGTAARMGPGYFPFWLGICMALLGAYVSLSAFLASAEETDNPVFDWKMVFVLIGAVVLCGITFNFLGVYLSLFLLVFISSMAAYDFNWKVAAIVGVAMMIFTYFTFVRGLGLIFPLWPSFLNL